MPVELKQDSLNVIDLTDVGVSMQAIEDKIIILVDEYKSGFECKVCKGTGRIPSPILEGSMRSCDECDGKGQILHIPDTAKSMPSTGVVVSMGPKTEYMMAKRDLELARKNLAIAVADPNTDTEFYKSEVDDAKEALNNVSLQIGVRVVFGVHVGTKIPIKGNIKLTIMREKEPLCIVFGSDIGDKAILDYTQENI